MANNYLITGYWGEPHVTAENDRGINAGMLGVGRFVLPVGERFKAEYIGNNIIRMYDGKLVDNGAAAGIPAGEYIDFQIANTSGSTKYRTDFICFVYTKVASTLRESGTFVVMSGSEHDLPTYATDPILVQNDLLTNEATMDMMPLWKVNVHGGTITIDETPLFTVSESISNMANTIYPVGSVYISTSTTSPAALFGGTWERISQGRTLIGAGSSITENNDDEFGSVNNAGYSFLINSTGGQFRRKMSVDELPNYAIRHASNQNTSTKTVYGLQPTLVDLPNEGTAWMDGAWYANMYGQTDMQEYSNNMQPYLAVYMWKRTA